LLIPDILIGCNENIKGSGFQQFSAASGPRILELAVESSSRQGVTFNRKVFVDLARKGGVDPSGHVKEVPAVKRLSRLAVRPPAGRRGARAERP